MTNLRRSPVRFRALAALLVGQGLQLRPAPLPRLPAISGPVSIPEALPSPPKELRSTLAEPAVVPPAPAGAPRDPPAPAGDPFPGAIPLRGEDPLRPLGLGFWLVLAAGLGGVALGRAWQRWRPRPGGQEPGAPGLLAAGGAVGPYRIVRPLGHGAFATTFLARHRDSGREVALKVLHPHRLQDADFLRRFGREARLGADLEHPGLVRLLDPGPGEHCGWIAFEFVPGPTLEAHLKERGPLPPPEAAGIALGIAEALACLHAHGLVHRDLKPANVLLAADGPKVLDLGIARELDRAGQISLDDFLGTPRYAAPEVQHGAGVGPAADRYSLGAILFEMLAGRPVFPGRTPFALLEQHRTAPVPDLEALCPGYPGLARLVERLLAKEPEQRPEDGELVAKLGAQVMAAAARTLRDRAR